MLHVHKSVVLCTVLWGLLLLGLVQKSLHLLLLATAVLQAVTIDRGAKQTSVSYTHLTLPTILLV